MQVSYPTRVLNTHRTSFTQISLFLFYIFHIQVAIPKTLCPAQSQTSHVYISHTNGHIWDSLPSSVLDLFLVEALCLAQSPHSHIFLTFLTSINMHVFSLFSQHFIYIHTTSSGLHTKVIIFSIHHITCSFNHSIVSQ